MTGEDASPSNTTSQAERKEIDQTSEIGSSAELAEEKPIAQDEQHSLNANITGKWYENQRGKIRKR